MSAPKHLNTPTSYLETRGYSTLCGSRRIRRYSSGDELLVEQESGEPDDRIRLLKKELSHNDRLAIIALFERRITIAEVARIMQVDRTYIYRWLERLRNRYQLGA
ncbi:MAG: helix-turn-helix domain-containing protein [Planctomycetaceae bacterium]|nr:helix-turn-helix domain-containing protein [Planctomycetaceae bacterium]